MTKVTDYKVFLDSSAWLGYFIGNIPETKTFIDSKETILFTSIISIHEIYKRLKKLGKSEKEIVNSLSFIENNSIIVNLNKRIAIDAVHNCEKHKLHTIDSLIYSSAMHIQTEFVTADTDFKNLPKAIILTSK
ncbi:MAG: PIN domain-containing protein [Candidatus Diapherotrites archaeon]|nr:PIN domain-containing protein [Candidatus Diapherotrites archaeon]